MCRGTRWRCKPEGCAFDCRWFHYNFLIDIIFRPHKDPWVGSASNRNENHQYFLESKDDRCVGLTTLPLPCVNSHEIWELQPPGTLRGCPDLFRDCFHFIVPFCVIKCKKSAITSCKGHLNRWLVGNVANPLLSVLTCLFF
jgi:hypothetical protein